MSETDYAPMNSEVEAPPPLAPEPAPEPSPEPAPEPSPEPAPARPPPLAPVTTTDPPPTMETQESSDPFMKGVNEIIRRLSAIVANFEKGARKGSGTSRARAPAATSTPAASTEPREKGLTAEEELVLQQRVNANANGLTEIPFSTIRSWYPEKKIKNDDVGMAFAFSDEWAIKNTNNKPKLQYAKGQPDVFSSCHNTINHYRDMKYKKDKTKRTDLVPPPEPSAKTTAPASAPPPPPEPAAEAPPPDEPLGFSDDILPAHQELPTIEYEAPPEDYSPLNEFDQYDGGFYD